MNTKLAIILAVAVGVAIAVAGLLLLNGAKGSPPTPSSMLSPTTTFTVRIDNIAGPDAIVTSDGSTAPFALSPVGWAVHEPGTTLFSRGMSESGMPLERLAEDGNPVPLVDEIAMMAGVSSSGVVNTPVGSTEPGLLTPGGSYEFQITASPGMWLSFVTMFGQSNDLFYGAEPPGIELFDSSGNPISGDVTSMIYLWDAGTEVNQEPGVGSDQAPRQAAPNTGEDENGVVGFVNDGFTYPNVIDVLRVTITPMP